MTRLSPTDLYGRIAYLGVNRDRDHGLASAAVETVRVTYAGLDGEAHSGLTRASCVRVKRQYPSGTEIKNARQATIVSVEELAEIADALGLPEPVRPEWLGANLALEGIPQLSKLPPSTRLIFEDGLSLVVDLENGPCKYPAELIERAHPGKGLDFPKRARGLRGVTAWVERQGTLTLGGRCRAHLPPVNAYPAER